MYKRSGIKMENKGTVEGLLLLPPPVVAIAINGHSNSKYVVQWALDKFVLEGNALFKLLHVRPRITAIPTPSKLFCSVLSYHVD